MSYTLCPYLVDLEKLKKTIGSNDQKLIQAIVTSNPDEFHDNHEDLDDDEEDNDDEISLKQALEDLVVGKKPDAESAHQYGYALEKICRYIGDTPAETDSWSGIHWEVLESTGVDQILSKSGPPVKLPPISDFPTIGYLTTNDISSVIAKMVSGPLKTAAPTGVQTKPSMKSKFGKWMLGLVVKRLTGMDLRQRELTDEDRRELLDEYEGWIREAASKKKSIVFFYY